MSKINALWILALLVLLVAPAQGQNQCQADSLGSASIEPLAGRAQIERAPSQMTAAAGGWTLVCPRGCTATTTTNPHGQTRTFCDCDGDGEFDAGVCQIWLKGAASAEIEPIGERNYRLPSGDFDPALVAAGGQTPICAPGCGEGEQCSMITINKPDGTTIKYCQCL